MKKAELAQAVERGEVVCVGSYWSGRIDKTSVRDKKDPKGQRHDAWVTRETIMTEKEPISVTRWLKDGEKPEEWKPSATRGTRVVVRVTGMEINLGAVNLSGTIEPLE